MIWTSAITPGCMLACGQFKNGHKWVLMDACSHVDASQSIMHMHDCNVCWDTVNKPAATTVTHSFFVFLFCSAGSLTLRSATAVHNSILAIMVTGHSTPPARLHTLKTSMHPTHAAQLLCQDKDCLHKKHGCKGNRWEKGLGFKYVEVGMCA